MSKVYESFLALEEESDWVETQEMNEKELEEMAQEMSQ